MKTAKLIKHEVRFDSDGLALEGILYLKADSHKLPAVIVCHPHPQYGGSMDNNVVNSVCESLAKAGLIAFKFNFRGVEGSEGDFDNGRGEQLDVKAALEYLTSRPEVDSRHLGLTGYSAGAAWGLKALYADSRITAQAAISPPLELFDFGFLKNCHKPTLLLSGGRDDLSLAGEIGSLCSTHPLFLSCRIVPEADHSWFGYEGHLSELIARFWVTQLCPDESHPARNI